MPPQMMVQHLRPHFWRTLHRAGQQGGRQAHWNPLMLQQSHQWVQRQATVSVSAKLSTLMKVCLVSDGVFSCVRVQGLLLLTI